MAFVAVLIAPALVACGFGAQTDQIYQAAQGVDDRTTSVKILNAVVVAAQDGSGTFAGSFVNESDEVQTLDGVTGEGVTAAKTTDIEVTSQRLLNLGDPVEGPDGEAVPLLTLTGTPIEIGRFVRLTFTFSGAGNVVVNVPVVSAESELGTEFVNVPLPAGSAEPTAEPTEGESTEPSTGSEAPEGESTGTPAE